LSELAQPPESPVALLREVLEKDRAALEELKKEAPWYVPDAETMELIRRIEACISANTETQRLPGGNIN
jgi:hypothetical protein